MGTSAAAYGIFPRRYSRSLCLVGPSARSVSPLAREEHAFVLTFRVPVTWRVPWRKQSLCAPSRSLSPPQGEVATVFLSRFYFFPLFFRPALRARVCLQRLTSEGGACLACRLSLLPSRSPSCRCFFRRSCFHRVMQMRAVPTREPDRRATESSRG